ncbi:hypothetical protein I4641_14015 [Waterburya agarophytonicola K14]|uniref:Uncharacterized protein n=1 Tax=Waterburya agarophytonicola KI4 TaxID=2874699 RepID=A0A964BTS8_9CYAN|nr:hypothetical protein [Waterburya agarophytonicola]MCC0178096.1 hypothetical protein [Waterburya agarophytonicola KI4]
MALLRITLTTEENKTLQELEVADSVPRRTKQRATALRLNGTEWKVKAIALIFKKRSHDQQLNCI